MQILSRVLFFALLGFAIRCSAGGGAVGTDGGHGLACANHIGYQLLDVVEAKVIFGTIDFPNPTTELRNPLASRLAKAIGSRHPLVALLRNSPNLFLSFSSALKPTTDFVRSFVKLPAGCRIVQLANFESSGKADRFVQYRADLQSLPNDSNILNLLMAHEQLHTWFPSHTDNRPIRQLLILLLAPKDYRDLNADLIRTLVGTKALIDWSRVKRPRLKTSY